MRSIWHSLLWKEWNEHKWKLATLVLLVYFTTFAFWPKTPRMLPVVVASTIICYGVFGLFVGMATAGGENGRGTMPFLRTLPTSLRKAAAIKLAMSWATLVAPILLLIGLASAYCRWHAVDSATMAEMADSARRFGPLSTWGWQNWLLGLGLSGTLGITSLLVWTASAGVNRADEIRAGATSFLTMASVWFGLGMLGYWAVKWNWPDLARGARVLMAAAPGGSAILGSGDLRQWSGFLPAVVAIVLVVHASLAARFAWCFGRETNRPARALAAGAKQSSPTDWLAPPRANRWTAIVWQQLRETGPLALLAAAAVIAIASVATWISEDDPNKMSYSELLAAVTLSVGMFVTVVAGMGVFLEDVKPKVSLFWRSRPVDTCVWFAIKYLTGVVILALTFGTLLGLALIMQKDEPLLAPEQAKEQIAFFALFGWQLYSLSMASYLLCRQPIFAAVTTLVVFFCGMAALEFLLRRLLPESLSQPSHLSVGLAAFLLAQAITTAIAWLTFRHDWRWHR